MTYSAFQQLVAAHFQKTLGDKVQISIQSIPKNNHICLDGLIVTEPDCNISPTLYLNYYYREFCNGASIDSILARLLDTYYASRADSNIDVRFFTDYDQVSPRILYKLINTAQNQELLQDIPHISFLDLSIVFYCLLTPFSSGNATILIHNHHLSFWNATTEMLYQCAVANTPRLLPPKLLDMNHFLSSHLPNQDTPPFVSPMYILTNSQKLYGAAGMLNQHILSNFALTRQSDFYILPSSIHEVLLLPSDKAFDPAELNKMVQEVNDSQLSREEILSDHVYYYSLKNHAIEVM